MPARSSRVQKKPCKTKQSIRRRKAAIDVASEVQCTSAGQGKRRSISLSSGPDLADIPAYGSDQAIAERTTRSPENANVVNQGRRGLRPISGNEVNVDNVIDKRERSHQQSVQQRQLPSFYSYDIEQSLLPLTKRYPAVNPEYFQEIFENRFKPENLANLANDFSTSCRSTKKQVTEGDHVRIVNIEDDAVPEDIEDMDRFTICFLVYTEALAHVAGIGRPVMGRRLRNALSRYHLHLLKSQPTANNSFRGLRAYHFMFHKTRAILGIDDPAGWESYDSDSVRQYLLKEYPHLA